MSLVFSNLEELSSDYGVGQAIAPFFITLRVANQRTSTINPASEDTSSVRFRNYGNPASENETLLDVCSTSSGATSAGLGAASRDS